MTHEQRDCSHSNSQLLQSELSFSSLCVVFEMVAALADSRLLFLGVSSMDCLDWALVFVQKIDVREGKGFSRQQ